MADFNSILSIISSLGFTSTESLFVLILVIFFGIIVVVAVIAPSRVILDLYPYTYPNARVRARMGRLISEKQFSEIIEADDVEEIKNYLRGFPDYAKYLNQYDLEKALDSQLAENYELLANISPDKIKEAFTFLFKEWDIKNIKSIIIAKNAGLSREETLDLIVPFGSLQDRLDRMIDAENINDVINNLEGTEYSKILEDALPEYEKTGVLLPLETSLDKYVLINLLRTTATPEDDNTSYLHEYIGNIVDTNNIKTILRAKADGLQFDDIEPYMISDGYQVREWKLKDLMETGDIEGIVGGLEGTDYGPLLSDALSKYSETKSISTFESALDDHVNQTAKKIKLKNQFGIGPLIGFLNGKEVEVRNLKMIIRGKREGNYSNAMIREMLI